MSEEETKDIEKNKTDAFDIPDGGYGWVIVGANFLLFMSTWGSNTSYAIYLAHYLRDDPFPGGTKYAYSAIGGMAFGSGMFFAHPINFLVGKLGFKAVMCIGAVCQFLGVFLASYARTLWELILTQGLLQGLSLSLLFIPGFSILPQWFRRRRTLAMGLTSAGAGSGLLFNLGLQSLSEHAGYKWTLRTQSFICVFLNVIVITLMKSRQGKIKPIYKFYDKLVFSSFGMWVFVAYEMITVLGFTSILYCLSNWTQSLGYTPYQGSIVSSMVSLGALFGRPAVGFVGDKIGPVNVTIIASFLTCVFALAMWIPAHNYASAIVFALIAGSLCGTIWTSFGAITARIVGLRRFQIGLALSLVFESFASVSGPIIVLALRADGPNDPRQYRHPAIFVGVCYFVSAVLLVIVRAWLIARDEISLSLDDSYKGGESDITLTVPPAAVLANIFKLKAPKT